jgi:glutamine transport system substrate-binding protein
MSRKAIGLVALGILLISFGLVGCSQKAADTSEKVLRIGAAMTFVPFEFQAEGKKEYVGFDIDLAKAVAKQMGYKVEIKNIEFDGLIPALEAGTIDMIVSGMSITDERSKRVAFSQPYYKSGLSIAVKNENTSIANFIDLRGKKVAVQSGTTSAVEIKKIKDTKVQEYRSSAETFKELMSGRVDAVVNDLPVNEYYLSTSRDNDAKIVGEGVSVEEYGMAVSLNNKALADKVNKAFEELKKNGEYEKIYMKWFNKKPQ